MRSQVKLKKRNKSLALLLIDIDGFKDVNDHYSHQSGDAVLKQMSQLLKTMSQTSSKYLETVAKNFLL